MKKKTNLSHQKERGGEAGQAEEGGEQGVHIQKKGGVCTNGSKKEG